MRFLFHIARSVRTRLLQAILRMIGELRLVHGKSFRDG